MVLIIFYRYPVSVTVSLVGFFSHLCDLLRLQSTLISGRSVSTKHCESELPWRRSLVIFKCVLIAKCTIYSCLRNVCLKTATNWVSFNDFIFSRNKWAPGATGKKEVIERKTNVLLVFVFSWHSWKVKRNIEQHSPYDGCCTASSKQLLSLACHYPQLTLFGGQDNTCHLGVGMYLQEEKKNMSYK